MAEKTPKLLILFSTVDGHTKHICEYMVEKLKDTKKITISSIENSHEHILSDFNEVVIGG